MGEQADQAPVPGEDGRGGEGDARVLHPAEGEAGRQHDGVPAAPRVGAVELLRDLDHLLDVHELRRRATDHRRLGVDAGAVGEGAELQLAGGEGDEVGRDRVGHPEAEDARGGVVGAVLGAHHDLHPARRPHHRVVGHAHARAVRERDPRARVDGLGLREEERHAARRWSARGPSHCSAEASGLVRYWTATVFGGRRRGQRDAQPLAEVRDRRLELVKASGLPPAVTDSMTSPRVSRSRCRALSGSAGVVELEGGRSRDDLPLEVEGQVERHVASAARSSGLAEGMDVGGGEEERKQEHGGTSNQLAGDARGAHRYRTRSGAVAWARARGDDGPIRQPVTSRTVAQSSNEPVGHADDVLVEVARGRSGPARRSCRRRPGRTTRCPARGWLAGTSSTFASFGVAVTYPRHPRGRILLVVARHRHCPGRS